MLDLRRYAGKMVIVGQLESDYTAHGFNVQRCHVLGTHEAGRDLPATVKAILEDLEAEAPEASEVLWVLEVDDQGTAAYRFPLVVFDEQERLRYGAEFLTVVQETGITTKALVVRGVRLEEPC
jgi:anion-transporting  ArsA/GET3 family ATPase